jgi:hypothetical protein
MLNAAQYTPVDETLIPTGKIESVEGTPLDFRTPTAIGARIIRQARAAHPRQGLRSQLGGPAFGAGLVEAARVLEPTTGRTLAVATTETGIQFYSGNFLDGTLKGKGARTYTQSLGFLPRNAALSRLTESRELSDHRAQAGRGVPLAKLFSRSASQSETIDGVTSLKAIVLVLLLGALPQSAPQPPPSSMPSPPTLLASQRHFYNGHYEEGRRHRHSLTVDDPKRPRRVRAADVDPALSDQARARRRHRQGEGVEAVRLLRRDPQGRFLPRPSGLRPSPAPG